MLILDDYLLVCNVGFSLIFLINNVCLYVGIILHCIVLYWKEFEMNETNTILKMSPFYKYYGVIE